MAWGPLATLPLDATRMHRWNCGRGTCPRGHAAADVRDDAGRSVRPQRRGRGEAGTRARRVEDHPSGFPTHGEVTSSRKTERGRA